jgi:surface protein
VGVGEGVHRYCTFPYSFVHLTRSLIRPIAHRHVGEVTNMGYLFYYKRSFNADISGWVTSKVTTMDRMFGVASAFNQPIGNWDVFSATNMDYMFFEATDFSQNLSTWCVWDVINTPQPTSPKAPQMSRVPSGAPAPPNQ